MKEKGFLLPLLLVCLVLILSACSALPGSTQSHREGRVTVQQGGPATIPFQGSEYTDNPLIGQFWSPATESFVSWREVARYMPRGGWLMLGEQHDHPDHHLVQAYFIYYLAERGLLGHVAMEMIASDQQRAIDAYQGAPERVKPEDLNWPSRGWPWERYEHQVKAALELSPRLIFGDLSTEQKNAVRTSEEGIAHYSDRHTAFMAELIVASHCNMFSIERATPMVDMQIARDQVMAQQMIAHALPGQVGVFIAGSGHVRADYGAPLWMAEDVPVHTLILVGVGEGSDPRDYLKVQGVSSGPEEKNPADLLFFVPGIPKVDYCESFRQSRSE